MPKEIMQEITTTTVRRNFIGDITPERKASLLKDGWHHDRLADQYRKIGRERKVYVDGVEVEQIGEVAGDSTQTADGVDESVVANKLAA